MPKPDVISSMPRFIMLASIAVVLAGLYFAQDVLVPLALAALLSFLLAPLVKRMERFRLPRSAAVVVTVLFALSILFGIGWIVFNQLGDLKSQLPQYRTNIEAHINSMRGPVKWLHTARAEVKEALAPATEAATKPTAGTNNSTVKELSAPIVKPEPAPSASNEGSDSGFFSNQSSPLDLLKPVGSFLLGPVGTAFIVTVFTIFMLLQREDLRDRLIRLVGRNRLTLTTQALDDAAERVSRYLLMQSIVNGSVGLVVMIALWSIGRFNGTPFPAVALWGLLAALLRFIPYIGIWVSSITPILLALAVYPTGRVALETFFAYGTIEVLAGNVFEPMLYGSSTGIATLAVLVAAAFWTWLWGPVGLLLSTPLTVCLVVMGKYVPQLEFLTILLAEEPALAPSDRVYQRLLALDPEEAADLVSEYHKKMPLEEVYETVLVPALAMAEQDLHQGNLDEEQHLIIQRGIRDMVDELGDQMRATVAKTQDDSSTRVTLPKGCVVNVVCLPANDESDEIAGVMLSQLLELRGYCTKVVSVTQLASEMVETVQNSKADVVCISALPPAAVTHARYLCKRLHGKLPEMEMMVGLWTTEGDLARARERIAAVRSVQVASTFSVAIEQIHQMAQPKLMAVV
jgi:predicted PurR-regulated permease PerM/methanogenic corrinoid protein MtbC1